MASLVISALIIAAEVAVVLVLLFLIAMLLAALKQRQRKAKAREFVKNVRERVPQQRARLDKLVAELPDNDGEALNQRLEKLIKQEKRLYARVLAIFRGGNESLLAGLSAEVENLIQVGLALYTPDPGAGEARTQALAELEQQLHTVQAEKLALEQELTDVRGELERLQSEYKAQYLHSHSAGNQA